MLDRVVLGQVFVRVFEFFPISIIKSVPNTLISYIYF